MLIICRGHLSGSIRLHYEEVTGSKTDLKKGILLEVGFDNVTPNKPVDKAHGFMIMQTAKFR